MTMTKKLVLLVMMFLGCTLSLMAQNISGKVVDEKNNPLPYVSVVLQSVQDTSYVGGVATNPEGLFALPVKAGVEYALSVSYIGYVTVNRICKAGDIGTIVMKEDAMMLEEVSVIASRTQHDANGYIVNLRSSEIAKGKQSSDALAFLPGVSNEDGSYKINGLPVSEIYVDGVKLTSSDELKNLPADMIDKVKVNYLAGSNQNAAMTGGTIEISLRQPPQGGYYGALTGGTTLYPSYGFSNENIGGIMYYRYKNLSIYDNLSLNFNQPEETAEQTIWNESTDLRTEIEEETKYRGHTINNRLSLTQQINNKNSIGASYYIATNKLNTTSATIGNNINAIQSMIDGESEYLDQEATLKYTSILSQRGTTLDIIGDYFNRQSDNKSDYSYSDNTSSVSEDESSLNMYKLSVDLTDPRSQKLVWKYGASVQYITSDYTPTLSTADGSDRFQTSLVPNTH
ncbi:MAG: carboxypeptidase-like regulatory domain-containing protein [Bacteroides sp.]|nr:carboxypeptidase-like regulatory domain-containing protein [Bacteroides sp.]